MRTRTTVWIIAVLMLSAAVTFAQAELTPEPPLPREASEQVCADTIPAGVLINQYGKTAAKVRFRTGPSSNSAALGDLKRGTYVYMIINETGPDDGDLWTLISYNGKAGYIRSEYLNLAGQEEIDTYASMLSTPVPIRTEAPEPVRTSELSATQASSFEPISLYTQVPDRTEAPPFEPFSYEPVSTPGPTGTPESGAGSGWDLWTDRPFVQLPAATATDAPATIRPTKEEQTADATPAFTTAPRNLRVGFKGEEVREVQQRLKELGYFNGKVDGDFGTKTEEAVKEFQKANGLTADGKVGEKTLSKLRSKDAVTKKQAHATPEPEPMEIVSQYEYIVHENGTAEAVRRPYEYIILEDGTAEIVRYSGAESEHVIPEKLDGISVTGIGSEAFAGNEHLISIRIPDSVSSIGPNAFRFCGNLTGIIISPDSPYFAVMDHVIFSKPDKRLVFYPETLTDETYSIPQGILSVGENAFTACDFLINVEIPDSVTSIESGAFKNCVSLKEIRIPDSVTAIGTDAFSSCPGLTVLVNRGSYAAAYCKENGVNYTYPDANDWLNY